MKALGLLMLMVTIRERGALWGYGGGESSCTISGTPHHPISFVLALRAFALSGTPKSKEKRKKRQPFSLPALLLPSSPLPPQL